METKNYLLRSASVDITNKCNYRCLHCYNNSGEHNCRENELTDNQILSIFDQLCDYQPDSICICGGEPLLKCDLIYRICKLVKQKNSSISINMVSNGYFLTDDIALKLKTSGLDLIQISLDGSTETTHNWIRQNINAFKSAINAIKIAKKANLITNVACTPTKKNFNEMDDIIKLCEDLGVNTFRLQPLMLMGRGTNLDGFVLNDTEYHMLSMKVKNHLNGETKMDLEWGDPLQHIENIISTSKQNSFIDLGISAYGDIMISPYIPIMVGNLKNESLKEYFDCGLQNMYLDDFVKKSASLITDWDKMNMNKTLDLFPILGSDKNINYDLLHRENNDIKIIKMILNYSEDDLC